MDEFLRALWVPRPPVSFVQPTFEKFFTSEELAEIAGNAGTAEILDFNSALGDTIREKYESVYVKCCDLNDILLTKGAAGYFWIVTSPDLSCMFEMSRGFRPNKGIAVEPSDNLGVRPQGVRQEPSYIGAINNRWRIYTDFEMPTNLMVMGCNDTLEDYSHYAILNIFNYIYHA